MYNSTLSGQAWLQELLGGHPVCFHDSIRMSKHVFRKLVHKLQMYAGLEDSKHITKEEQLAIFLHLCRTGTVTHDVREHFQWGPETISKCVLVVLVYFLLFSEQFWSEYSVAFWRWWFPSNFTTVMSNSLQTTQHLLKSATIRNYTLFSWLLWCCQWYSHALSPMMLLHIIAIGRAV